MEILSTGEKIKRARIYQGITLKELCGEKISISKMSCIENEKIKADEDILKYISNKLDLKYDYLVQDVKEQLISNIELLKSDSIVDAKIGEVIKYNLKYAMEYSYFQLAFQLIHKLFKYYMDKGLIDDIQHIISQYYDLFQMNNSFENMMVYYRDMARFFMKNKEYNEAVNYYKKIMSKIEKYLPEDKVTYTYSALNIGICYMMVDEINLAYTMVSKAVDNIDYIENKIDKGKIYHVYANINILLYKVETEKYLNLAFEYQKDDKAILAMAKGENGKSYFTVGEFDKAKSEICEGINIFQQIEDVRYVDYLIYCIDVLYKYKEYDLAMELLDEALNLSICSDDVRLIERAYYFKGMMLQKYGKYLEAEMYMNLSTDNLLRFASKEERFKRYNEMGELYYNLNELKEAIKYFTLAMNLEKKL